jgi:hypothetical protein
MLPDFCQCIMQVRRPTARDILQRLSSDTVCLGNQCFESLEDSGIIMMAPPQQFVSTEMIMFSIAIFSLLVAMMMNMKRSTKS